MGHSHDSDPVAWRWRLRSVGRWHLIDEPANQATADHPSFEQEALYSGVGAHLPGEPDAHAVYTMLTAKAKARTSTDNVSDVLDSVRACRLGATVAPDAMVTLAISVARDGSIASDIQTHDNSYAEVLTGLALVKVEIERVFAERKDCPYHPRDKAEANKKIIRAASGAGSEPTAEPLLILALNALVYHRAQTRPIAQTDVVIDALRAALAVGTEIPQKQPPATDRNVAVGSTRFSDGEIQTKASLADEIRKSMLAAADEAIAANAVHQVEAPIQLPDVDGTV